MPPDELNPWLGLPVLALIAASAAMWMVFVQSARRGPVLPYEPRTPVPWGPLGPALLVLFVVFAATGDPPAEPTMKDIAAGVLAQFALFGLFFAAIAVIYRATLRDVGVPDSRSQFLQDVKLGVIVWLLAVLPVYGLQAIVVSLSEPSSHPLIQVMLKERSWLVFALAMVSAVVLAPLSEEIAFRLLLQGWLEKWEDRRVRTDEGGSPDEWTIQAVSGSMQESTDPLVLIGPARRGFAGLPHGWLPILMSSAIFAGAHWGHGPDPIALFLLAIMLGYTYQRTHRIVPSIVTHMLLNLTSLAMLWLAIAFGGEVAF